jgi:hypothetical protein
MAKGPHASVPLKKSSTKSKSSTQSKPISVDKRLPRPVKRLRTSTPQAVGTSPERSPTPSNKSSSDIEGLEEELDEGEKLGKSLLIRTYTYIFNK